MYALGQLTVAMCSMLLFLIIDPSFYQVAISSALFFTALGFWLILGDSSTEKKWRWIEITAGSLCMALAVGCRANHMFFLLLIPVVLLGELKELWNDRKRFIGFCACVAVPCTLVVCSLLWYNYIRFGSVFETGNYYVLGGNSVKAGRLMNPLGRLTGILIGCISCLIPSFHISASFPFISLQIIEKNLAFKTASFNITPMMGLMSLPVTWFVFNIGTVKKTIDKQREPILYLIVAMICLGFLQIVATLYLVDGIVYRYAPDFFWLFILSGLFCAYYIYERLVEYQRQTTQIQSFITLNLSEMIERIIFIAMVLSISLSFLITLSGKPEFFGGGTWNTIFISNPSVFYSLQRLLGFNTW